VTIAIDDPVARAVVEAIRAGDVGSLDQLLRAHPGLERARLQSENGPSAGGRSLLHIATDWPGHYPNGPAVVALLVAAGADVNACFVGAHAETPLHWAASSDNVKVIDALLDAGADIEAPGAVIVGGTPLSDAVAFGQWRAARRLVERGATTMLREAAALGLMDRVEAGWSAADGQTPTPAETTEAFWYACHGGQQAAAGYLLDRGADLNWVSRWDDSTPLDAAGRSGHTDLVGWLRQRGARSAAELDPHG
jgi:ankyrin repeat protein